MTDVVLYCRFTKQNEYDPVTGMDSLKVTSISAVQARQRAGRAGRTRAGRCFRLYTREHFELDMPTTTVPEIQRTSLVGTVLYLKTLRLEGLDVLDFDFLDKPDLKLMGDALRQLYALGAIDEDGSVTTLGREMSPLPVEPQLAQGDARGEAVRMRRRDGHRRGDAERRAGVHGGRAAAGGGG